MKHLPKIILTIIMLAPTTAMAQAYGSGAYSSSTYGNVIGFITQLPSTGAAPWLLLAAACFAGLIGLITYLRKSAT